MAPLLFITVAQSSIDEHTEIGLSSISGVFFWFFFGRAKKNRKKKQSKEENDEECDATKAK